LRSVKGLLNRLPFRGKIVNQSIKINFLQTANRRKASYVYDGIVPPDPSPDDIQRIGNDIASQFDDVFDQIGSLNCMEGPEMIIELTDDATHFYVNGSRPLPFADHPAVKKLLDDYVEKKIICPVTEPSDWAAPLVVTRKSDGSLRICVDQRVSTDSCDGQLTPLEHRGTRWQKSQVTRNSSRRLMRPTDITRFPYHPRRSISPFS
jgi:hypothetical protein